MQPWSESFARMLCKLATLTFVSSLQSASSMLLPLSCRALSRVGTAGFASKKPATSPSAKTTAIKQEEMVTTGSHKKGKVPRALGAYNFFIKEQALARKREPGVKPSELLTVLAREWKTLNAQQKRPYESMAAKSKADAALARDVAKSNRRPLAAYAKWCSEVMNDLSKSHPDMKATDKMKEAAARWKVLPAVEKDRRAAEARAARQNWAMKQPTAA